MPILHIWALAALLASESPTEPRPAFRLIYDRAPEAETCPDAAALRGEIAARIGRDPFQEPADRIVAVAVRRASATELEASLTLRSAAGEPLGSRTLQSTGSDCAELANALVLALSIAIDPLSLGRVAPLPLPPTPAAEPPPAPAPAPPAPSVPLAFSLTAGPALGLGLAPSADFGLRVGAELRRARFSVGIEGQGFLPAGETKLGGTVSAAPLLLGLSNCAWLGWFAGCALVEGGALNGSGGGGFNNATSGFTPLVALGARAQADFPLWFLRPLRLALRPQAEILVPLIQTSLTLENPPLGTVTAWTTSPVAGAFALAAVVTLP